MRISSIYSYNLNIKQSTFGKSNDNNPETEINVPQNLMSVDEATAIISNRKPFEIWNYDTGKIQEREFFDGSYEEYSDSGFVERRTFEDGREERFYKKNKKSFESFEDGTWKSYYPNGNMYAQEELDGTFTQYLEDGSVSYVCYPDNSEIEYLYDLGLIYESNEEIRQYRYMDSDVIAADICADGTKKIYSQTGNLKYELYPNGKQYKYNEDGRKIATLGLDEKDTIDLIFS